MGKRESSFQQDFIEDLITLFPDCIILKNDPTYIQGIPDLLVLNNNRWAALECKKSKDAPARPNQPYYIKKMNEMSYASFVYPENKEVVLHEIQQALQP